MRVFRLIVLSVAAALAVAFGSSSSPTNPTPSNSTAVSIVAGSSTLTTTAYAPNPVTIAVGGSVTWMNNDNTTHTASANGGAFDTGNIAPGSSVTKTFSAAGS